MPTNDVTTPAVILAFTMSASLTSITPVKVAAVATLCQDARVFDAMMMAGTPCPYKGKIGKDALKAWEENPDDVPVGSTTLAENTQMIETQPLPIEETRGVKSDDYSIYESQD